MTGSITVWTYWSSADVAQSKMLKDWATSFQKTNPGAKVNYVYVSFDQLESKLIAAAGAKTGPDAVILNGGGTGNVATAALADLTDRWNAFDGKSQFPAGVVHQLDGKVYSVQGYVNLLGLWYNKDILNKIGVQPPTTLDELNADMAKAKSAGYQGISIPGTPDGQGEFSSYPWLTSAGFSYSKPTQAALAAGLSIPADWVKKGYLSKEAATWDNTVPFQKFQAGGIAFNQTGNWNIANGKTMKFHYGVVPLPLSSTGGIYLGGEAAAVGKFAKNPDLAWAFIEQTVLSKAGGLAALNDVGSIPSRKDAAQDSEISTDPILKAYSDEVAKYGAAYPASADKPDGVTKQWLLAGQAWSAVIAGASPTSAAATAWNTLPSLLNASS